MRTEEDNLHYYQHAVEMLVAEAAQHGVVVTVTQVPEKPLAVGNYSTKVEVRHDRPTSQWMIRNGKMQ